MIQRLKKLRMLLAKAMFSKLAILRKTGRRIITILLYGVFLGGSSLLLVSWLMIGRIIKGVINGEFEFNDSLFLNIIYLIGGLILIAFLGVVGYMGVYGLKEAIGFMRKGIDVFEFKVGDTKAEKEKKKNNRGQTYIGVFIVLFFLLSENINTFNFFIALIIIVIFFILSRKLYQFLEEDTVIEEDVNFFNKIPMESKRIKNSKKEELLYRVKILELIKQGLDLTDKGDFEQANDLLYRLSEHKTLEPYIDEYLSQIYANMGHNYLSMKEYHLAFHCFKASLIWDEKDEVAQDGMQAIRQYLISKLPKSNDKFDLLRGFTEQIVEDKKAVKKENQYTPYQYINMLGFDRFDDFFVRLMYCFIIDKEKFGCGACCRSLIPKIVREGQKITKGDMTFNDIISLFWIIFSEEEKRALKEQYFHYFYEIKKGPRTKMYSDFCKQIGEKINIV